MAESIDSRKLERKPMFDAPLPMRRAPVVASGGDDSANEETTSTPNTMAFSLVTKKGNRQHVSKILAHSPLDRR